jgi:uncharacterized protein involved in exopolysaccharide biosynthesis
LTIERAMNTARRQFVSERVEPRILERDASYSAFSSVLRYLLASALVILIFAVVAGGVTYLVRSNQDPTYAATAEFAIVPSALLSNGAAADQVESVAALDRPIVNATVSELLQSGIVAETAARAVGVPMEELDKYDFAASEVPGAAIVRLSVKGPDAETVRALAQAVHDANGPISDYLIGIFTVRSIDESAVSATKVGPTPTRDAAAVALAVALASGAIAIVIRTRRSERAPLTSGS